MKYKVGDIVVVKSLDDAPTNWSYNVPIGLITEVVAVWDPVPVEFLVEGGKYKTTCYPDKRFRLATKREVFLYHIYGVTAFTEEDINEI